MLASMVGCVSCRLPLDESAHCSPKATNATADDAIFATGPATAAEAATISAAGSVLYFGRSSSLPTQSTIMLDIAWDQSSVRGDHITCDDGTDKWGDYYMVPVTATLSTADELFSATLTGTVENVADSSGDLSIHFDDLHLDDLQGTFSWRDVLGSSEVDVCADVRIRFAALLQKSGTKSLVHNDQNRGFINVECPSDNPPTVAFYALAKFD
jgi:hypothetical protein